MKIENLCIHCMCEKEDQGKYCPYCGKEVSEYKVKAHHLKPFTILHKRYLLGKVLGEGGFGITYIGMDLIEKRRIAIKELFVNKLMVREKNNIVLISEKAKDITHYEECMTKFRNEAIFMKEMQDKKGIVDIYEYFEENHTAYIVMEYLDGEDLLSIVKKSGGKMPFDEVYQLLRPVMKSMAELNSKSIFHRDISPDNIRVLSDGSTKILDLGGAKYAVSRKKSDHITLKHGYAPPEQYIAGYKIGAWMDVYAMAATFYRCICGKVLKSSIERKSDSDIEKPSDLGVEISPLVEEVLMKALSLDTEDRYIDMREFYLKLRKAVYYSKLSEQQDKIEKEKKRATIYNYGENIEEKFPKDRKKENSMKRNKILITIGLVGVAIVLIIIMMILCF